MVFIRELNTDKASKHSFWPLCAHATIMHAVVEYTYVHLLRTTLQYKFGALKQLVFPFYVTFYFYSTTSQNCQTSVALVTSYSSD